MSRVGIRSHRPSGRSPRLELAELQASRLPWSCPTAGRHGQKTSALLGCSSAMLLNALQRLAGLPATKVSTWPAVDPGRFSASELDLGSRNPRLHTDEVLIALAVARGTATTARRAWWRVRCATACKSVIHHPWTRASSVLLGIQVTTEAGVH